VWSDLVAQPFYRQNRVNGVAPRLEVFRLKFLAGTRREAHAEVRKPLVPGAGHTHLLGAVLGRKLGNRVKVSGRQLRAEELWGRRSPCEGLPVSDASLDPDLVHPLALPVRKQPDAIPARLDFVEVLL
jgi:hypothetical protein